MKIINAIELTAAERAATLGLVAEKDPFAVANAEESIDWRPGYAAIVGGESVGLGWGWETPQGPAIDLRVRPEHRRKGVGSALFDALDPEPGTIASCDAAHLRAQRFLRNRGFTQTGLVFIQRWDGEPEDVPPAFRTAKLSEHAPDRASRKIIQRAWGRAWPPLSPGSVQHADRVVLAEQNGAYVGGYAARREADCWAVTACAVDRSARKGGVGRALLAELMSLAAKQGLGVSLRLDAMDSSSVEYVHGLGFWSCRSWAYYAMKT